MQKVSSEKYELVYGKKPRGWGSWAFVAFNGDTYRITERYSVAKKMAVGMGRERKTAIIEVLS